MTESPFTYLWFLILLEFDLQMNHDLWRIKMNKIDSNRKSNWIKLKIEVNQNELLRFVRFESESKLIRIKNKMIRPCELKIKIRFWFTSRMKIFFVIFDSLRRNKNSRIKMNRFGPSPALNLNSSPQHLTLELERRSTIHGGTLISRKAQVLNLRLTNSEIGKLR